MAHTATTASELVEGATSEEAALLAALAPQLAAAELAYAWSLQRFQLATAAENAARETLAKLKAAMKAVQEGGDEGGDGRGSGDGSGDGSSEDGGVGGDVDGGVDGGLRGKRRRLGGAS